MAKRVRLVILYSYNENWIGGTYYIQNLILALNKVDDTFKPQLLIAAGSDAEYQALAALTRYPYIQQIQLHIKHGIIVRALNKLSRKLFKKNMISTSFSKYDLRFQTVPEFKHEIKKSVLYWIPDFQEHYLPDFFSTEEVELRKGIQAGVASTGKYILFSSESARADFNRFYPANKLRQFVLNFAVTHSSSSELAIEDLLRKYDLPSDYFICCNQFWIHKNHQIVMQAVHKLKKQGKSVLMVFTGKEFDHRFPDHFLLLRNTCTELEIDENIRFLGFIAREEQLCLIRHARAVVQPSLFEGWSTVVEDAKALNAKIIASAIDVHHEQLEEYDQKLYFDPYNANELATCMLTEISTSNFDYEKCIIKYGCGFIEIVDSLMASN